MDSMRGTPVSVPQVGIVMTDDSDTEDKVLSTRIKQRDIGKAAYRQEVRDAREAMRESCVAKAIRLVHAHPYATLALGIGVAVTASGAVLTASAFMPNRQDPAVATPTPTNPQTTASTERTRAAFTTGSSNSTQTATTSGVPLTSLPTDGATTSGGSETGGTTTNGASTSSGYAGTTNIVTDGGAPTTSEVFTGLSTAGASTTTGSGTTSGHLSTSGSGATTGQSSTGQASTSHGVATTQQGATTNGGVTTNAGTTTGSGTTFEESASTQRHATPNPTTNKATSPAPKNYGCFDEEQAKYESSKSQSRSRRSADQWHKGMPRFLIAGKGAGVKVSGSCNINGEMISSDTKCFVDKELRFIKTNNPSCNIEKMGACSTGSGLPGGVDPIKYIAQSKSVNKDTMGSDTARCGVGFLYPDPKNKANTLSSCIEVGGGEAKFIKNLKFAIRNAINRTDNQGSGRDLYNKFNSMARQYENAGFPTVASAIKATAQKALNVKVNDLPNYVLSSSKMAIAMDRNSARENSGGYVRECNLQGAGSSGRLQTVGGGVVIISGKDDNFVVYENDHGTGESSHGYYDGDLLITGQADIADHSIKAQKVNNPDLCRPSQFYEMGKKDNGVEAAMIKPADPIHKMYPLDECIISDFSVPSSHKKHTEVTCITANEGTRGGAIESVIGQHTQALGRFPKDSVIASAVVELKDMEQAFRASSNPLGAIIANEIKDAINLNMCSFESYKNSQQDVCNNLPTMRVPTDAPAPVKPTTAPTTTKPAPMPVMPTTFKATTTASATSLSGDTTAGSTNGATTAGSTTNQGTTTGNGEDASTPTAYNTNGTTSYTSGFATTPQAQTTVQSTVDGSTTGVAGVTTDGTDGLWTTDATAKTTLPSSANVIPTSKWKLDKAELGTAMMGTGAVLSLGAIGAMLWGKKSDDRSYNLEQARKNSMKVAYKQAAQVEDNGYEGSDEEQTVALA